MVVYFPWFGVMLFSEAPNPVAPQYCRDLMVAWSVVSLLLFVYLWAFKGSQSRKRICRHRGRRSRLKARRHRGVLTQQQIYINIDMTIETVGGESCFATKSPVFETDRILEMFQFDTTPYNPCTAEWMFYDVLCNFVCAAHCRSFPYSNTEPTWIDLLRSYQKRIHFQITRIHKCTVICWYIFDTCNKCILARSSCSSIVTCIPCEDDRGRWSNHNACIK